MNESLTPGPTRETGRRCTVCYHPRREEIDAALVAGDDSFATLADRFALTTTSIQRHNQAHVPARLLRVQDELVREADRQFAHLTIAQSATRLAHLQECLDGLLTIKARRAAKATANAPGSETGLLLVRKRNLRAKDGTYRTVTESEVDVALIGEVRALHRAAAIETGEYLAQTGKGSFGAGTGVNGPLVVVLATGLQPLPGDAPQTARHRITDPRRRVTPSVAQSETPGVPLSMVDIEDGIEDEDTRQGALSGTSRDDDEGRP
jgi:hypothetical protein